MYGFAVIDSISGETLMAKAATKSVAKTKAAPKPAAKAASKAAVSTVTLRHIGTAISETHDLPKKQANAVLEDFVALVTKHLKKGDRIRIGGLGILQVRKRPARLGRNPATGEQIKIKASKKVAFRAAKDLKEQI
jgi:DNA-binding protein HU-beta